MGIHSFLRHKALKVDRTAVLPSLTVMVFLTLSMAMVLITEQIVVPVAGYILPQMAYLPYEVYQDDSPNFPVVITPDYQDAGQDVLDQVDDTNYQNAGQNVFKLVEDTDLLNYGQEDLDMVDATTYEDVNDEDLDHVVYDPDSLLALPSDYSVELQKKDLEQLQPPFLQKSLSQNPEISFRKTPSLPMSSSTENSVPVLTAERRGMKEEPLFRQDYK